VKIIEQLSIITLLFSGLSVSRLNTLRSLCLILILEWKKVKGVGVGPGELTGLLLKIRSLGYLKEPRWSALVVWCACQDCGC
jgi:hypothetical protein